jgi:hypothetical protein
MTWLKNVIIEGLQMCITVRLRNAPALETIEPVARVWIAVFERQPIVWNEERDLWRIQEAFFAILGDSETFPAPKKVLDYMPPRRAIEFRLPRPERTPMPPEIKQQVQQLLGKFGVKK